MARSFGQIELVVSPDEVIEQEDGTLRIARYVAAWVAEHGERGQYFRLSAGGPVSRFIHELSKGKVER